MSNILLIGGFILIKVWAIGFFGFHISGIIHILPVIVIFALLIKLFYKKSLFRKITLNPQTGKCLKLKKLSKT
jgi:hypothetical protein